MSTTTVLLKKFDDYIAEFIGLNQDDSKAIDIFWASLDADLSKRTAPEREHFMQQFLLSLKQTHQNVANIKSLVFHQ